MRMLSKRRAVTAVAMVLGVVVLAACAGGDVEESTGDATRDPAALFANGYVGDVDDPDTATRGGSIDFAAFAEVRSLDPADAVATGSSGGTELAALYDVLVRYDAESGEYLPHLAADLQSNEDMSQWTLTLRDDVTFSDGTAVDAAAVAWSIKRYLEREGELATLWSQNVAGFEPAGSDTLEFTLTSTWRNFPYLLASGPGMIVAAAADAGEKFTPIGAGPFVLEAYAPQEQLVLTAREGYWGEAPNLDSVRFITIAGGDATYDLLTAGQADMAYLREPDVVEEARKDGYAGIMNLESLGAVLLVNHAESSPLADARLRRAMAHAIDHEMYVERRYEGAGLPGGTTFQETSRWATETQALEHDPDAARALVQEAKDDGFDGEIVFLGTENSRVGGLALKAMLDDVGFDVRIDVVPNASMLVERVYVTRDFDFSIWGMGAPDYAVDSELYENFTSGSNGNPGGFSDPEFDALLRELQAATEDAEVQALLESVQERWNELVPALPMETTAEFVAWRDGVHGVVGSVDNIVLLHQAWAVD